MTISGQLSIADSNTRRGAGTSLSQCVTEPARGRGGTSLADSAGGASAEQDDPGSPQAADLEEANRLIDDLAALVDAGLVLVRRQPGGVARYVAVTEAGDAA